ncbi:MAG: hypothetical protein KC731_21575 [Myxococcales bacterium]|nr:hypothetical protein [Myxococcales bacterium]
MSKATDPFGQEAPDSLTELAQDAQKKKRRAILVVVGVAVAALGIGGAAWYFGEQAAKEQIATAWNETSACLVGAPLGDGEKASLRMRAIQLVAVHAERDRKADSRWPNRCADQVAQLHEALRKHGRDADGETGLAARSESFAVTLRKAEVMTDLSKDVDGVFEAAKGMGLAAQPATLQIPTPEPTKAFTLDSLPESARISPHQFTLDSVSATPMVGREIHIMVYDKKIDQTPIQCTFSPDGKDRCKALGGELVGKSGLRLGGTADDGASPLVFAGNEGDGGIYRSDGAFEKVIDMRAQSAWVSKDGYVALASYAQDRKDGRFDLVTQAAPTAPTRTVSIEPDAFGKGAYQVHRKQLLWGKLMVQTIFDKTEKTPRLFYADLPPREEAPSFSLIGDVNWINARIFGCRTAQTTVVGVGVTEGFLLFLEGDAWSSPVKIDNIGGAFGCHAGEAVFTNPFGGQERCTPAGCKFVEGLAPEWKPFTDKDQYWSDLSGKVLAVATTDRRGAVRYRWSEGKNLGTEGTDMVLFDDLVKDGAVQEESTVLGMMLGGRGDFAVVLLTTPKGVYALRFGADGKPQPATIQK